MRQVCHPGITNLKCQSDTYDRFTYNWDTTQWTASPLLKLLRLKLLPGSELAKNEHFNTSINT